MLILLLAAMQGAPPAPPAAFQRLVDCRRIAEPMARLACFDREAATVESAAARRELVVVDRQQIGQTRRSLFGLTLPRLGIFEGDEDSAPQTVEGTIASVGADRTGKWQIGFDEQVWRATEVDEYQSTPRVGQKVAIRKGPLGSYILSVEGRRGVRAVRVR